MPGMDSYTEAAMERAMKVQEMMLQAWQSLQEMQHELLNLKGG